MGEALVEARRGVGLAGRGAEGQHGAQARVGGRWRVAGPALAGEQLNGDGAEGVAGQAERDVGVRQAWVVAEAADDEADVVGPAGQLVGVHRRLEGAPQAEGRTLAEHPGVGARVLHGQRHKAVAGPVRQPLGAALAGAAEAVGEDDQAARPRCVGQVELEGQGARTAGVVNIAEAGEHPPGAGGAQVGQAAGGPTAQWAVHSTRPKCQVTSTTMPKAMRYQAKGTKSWLEM